MPLDTLQAGFLPLPQLGSTHDELVMVYAGILSTGGTAYQYGAQTGIVAVPSGPQPAAISLVAVGSASDRPKFVFEVPERLAGSTARLEVFDVAGRLAARLMSARAIPGHHEITWDGRAATAGRHASGVYFARLSVGGESAATRVMLLR